MSSAATPSPAVPPPVVVGNMTVSSGLCILRGVTVTGNVLVTGGSFFLQDGSTVNGYVQVTGGQFNAGPSTGAPHPTSAPVTVKGAVIFTGISPGANYLCNMTIGGNFVVQNLPTRDEDSYVVLDGQPSALDCSPSSVGGRPGRGVLGRHLLPDQSHRR